MTAAPLVTVPITGLIAPPAMAQVAVYDPANHAQNILQAVRALQDLEGQVQQLAQWVAAPAQNDPHLCQAHPSEGSS